MMINMGNTDRIIRVVVAITIISALYLPGTLPTAAAVVLGIIAVVLLVTALAGFCPAYFPFNLSTRRKK